MLNSHLTRRPAQPATVAADPFLQFVDRFFGDRAGLLGDALRGEDAGRSWLPPVDIRETDTSFVCTADLPGLGKDDIEITIEDDVLTISGERTLENDENETSRLRRIERSFGAFRRSFTLPTGIDTKKVDARFVDGVLTLTLPKAETAKPRRIKVS